ncbi:uncharacterized protein LOC142172778 [Nicotiana tabacum]|uniref:Uncharacterized protein LOC142172778 n=1 Tax=Nicotiana tabacum TaxID=4097 RepID=A0AC58T5P9_TOBAC
MEEHIWWKVGRGGVNFWFDNWTKQGPLCSKLEGVMVQQNIQVFEVYRNGQWDWSKLIPHPPNFIKEMVFSTTLNVSQQAHDTPIWTCSENGKFSTVFAWNLFRQKRHISQFDKRIWHNDVPYNMAFLTWKATHGRIPTDDKVSKFGMVPEVETVEHLFSNGRYAQQVWGFFAGKIGIPYKNTSLGTLLSTVGISEPATPSPLMSLKLCLQLFYGSCGDQDAAPSMNQKIQHSIDPSH